MKKNKYLLGLVITSILVLGTLPLLAMANPVEDGIEPEGPKGIPEGNYSLTLDFSLANTWMTGPTPMTPDNKTNTNLYYNVTDFETPLDQYFGIPLPMGEEGSSLTINASLVNSTVLAKIVNDQGDLIDWQAAFLLGDDIVFSFEWPDFETLWLESNDSDMPMFPFDLIPDEWIIPAGSATPPMPFTVKSPDTWEKFFDMDKVAHEQRGFTHGIPFFGVPMFYVDPDTLLDQGLWWNSTDANDTFYSIFYDREYPPEDNVTIELAGWSDGNFLESNIHFLVENQTYGEQRADIIVDFYYGVDGYLDTFFIAGALDFNNNGTLDLNETFEIGLALTSVIQDDIPVSVGDSGEYHVSIDLNIGVELVDETLQPEIDGFVGLIDGIVSEFEDVKLLNYTIDAMDGLYYTLDGYILDVGPYIQAVIDSYMGGGMGSEDLPFFDGPNIEDFYMPIMMDHVAINMFDQMIYRNTTEFYQIIDMDPNHYDDWGGNYPIVAFNETHLELPFEMPGITWLSVYNRTQWDDAVDDLTAADPDYYPTDDEIIDMLLTSHVPVAEGNPYYSYYQEHPYAGNYTDEYRTVAWLEGNFSNVYDETIEENWPDGQEALVVIAYIEELPGYHTYVPEIPFMFKGPEPEHVEYNYTTVVAMGSQDDYEEPPMDGPMPPMFFMDFLKYLLPKPAYTGDWEIQEGMVTLINAFIEPIRGIVTSPDYMNWVEDMVSMQEGVMAFNLNELDFGINWFENDTSVGVNSFFMLDADADINDSMNELYVYIGLGVNVDSLLLWDNIGTFDILTVNIGLDLSIDTEEWPAESEVTDTTTISDNTTEVTGENTTTPTNETSSEAPAVGDLISPGFELVLAVVTLVAIPVISKKRK